MLNVAGAPRMSRVVTRLALLLALFCVEACGAAHAQQAGLLARYPVGSIQSVERADAALAAVAKERAAIEARFAEDERACLPNFFTTACQEDAKERRRTALSQIRLIEVDANGFKRRTRVIERDQALSERQAQEKADAPLRRQEELEFEARVAKKLSDRGPESAAAGATGEVVNDGGEPTGDQQDARLKQRKTVAIGDAKKRAENRLAYQRKLKEAEARQQESALKKAQKERESAGKEIPVSPAQ